jgi:hypothetical protein
MSTVAVATTDIRSDLPVAVKTGPKSKPVWTINGNPYKFVATAKKSGVNAEGRKIRLGKHRIYAKFPVATKSPTVPGGVLEFVGVFAPVAPAAAVS